MIGHLNEILTAEDGSIIELELDPQAADEGDMVETVPVPQTSAGEDAICCSELFTSRVDDELWPAPKLLLLVDVKELKFFLT